MRSSETSGSMVRDPKAGFWRALKLSAVALGIGLVMTAGPVRAGDDDDDDDGMTFEEKIIDNLMSGIGAKSMEKPGIEYRERSPLVVPPKLDLPPPATQAKNAPNWPKDPEEKRRKEAIASAQEGDQGDGELAGGPTADARRDEGRRGRRSPPHQQRSDPAGHQRQPVAQPHRARLRRRSVEHDEGRQQLRREEIHQRAAALSRWSSRRRATRRRRRTTPMAPGRTSRAGPISTSCRARTRNNSAPAPPRHPDRRILAPAAHARRTQSAYCLSVTCHRVEFSAS